MRLQDGSSIGAILPPTASEQSCQERRL